MLYKYGKHVRMVFWVRFYFYFSLDSFLYFGGIFSAECTIGMVRGLTPLKHYGAMALWQ